MISIDDYFEFEGMLVAKSQLVGVLQVKQLAKDSFGFHIVFWGKERLVAQYQNKDQAEMMRTKWIKENLYNKPKPIHVCKSCGMVQE